MSASMLHTTEDADTLTLGLPSTNDYLLYLDVY